LASSAKLNGRWTSGHGIVSKFSLVFGEVIDAIPTDLRDDYERRLDEQIAARSTNRCAKH